jgi:reverse gyrase
MKTRPRTKFTRQVNSRRCPKCGGKVNNQRVRCKKCSQALTRPKKK